jgi:hypothetical protein
VVEKKAASVRGKHSAPIKIRPLIASLAKNFVGSRKKNEDTPRLEETSRRLYYVKY